jgi:hypothetical protein
MALAVQKVWTGSNKTCFSLLKSMFQLSFWPLAIYEHGLNLIYLFLITLGMFLTSGDLWLSWAHGLDLI